MRETETAALPYALPDRFDWPTWPGAESRTSRGCRTSLENFFPVGLPDGQAGRADALWIGS